MSLLAQESSRNNEGRREHMIVFYRLIVICSLLLLGFESASALQMLSPKEGESVYAGSDLTIIVKPDAGESFKAVATTSFEPLIYDPLKNEYRIKIKVPQHLIGVIDDLIVIGVDMAGNEIELKRNIFVKLQPNVVLQSISLSNEIMAIRKVPQGSNIIDPAKIETRQLGVAGIYSDGVSRQLASSAMGTTYISSDEKIATVSPEGKVTAQGVGTATITVRNGKYSTTVKVIVKPYK